MTKQEAAIISAYTGVLVGEISYFHEYTMKLLNRAVHFYEFGDSKFREEIKEKSKKDFISIEIVG